MLKSTQTAHSGAVPLGHRSALFLDELCHWFRTPPVAVVAGGISEASYCN
jgi:hypothetical protein